MTLYGKKKKKKEQKQEIREKEGEEEGKMGEKRDENEFGKSKSIIILITYQFINTMVFLHAKNSKRMNLQNGDERDNQRGQRRRTMRRARTLFDSQGS